MVVQMFAKLVSLVVLVLEEGLEEAEVALPEPAAGSKAKVRVTAWDKLVVEAASCLGMYCR